MQSSPAPLPPPSDWLPLPLLGRLRSCVRALTGTRGGGRGTGTGKQAELVTAKFTYIYSIDTNKKGEGDSFLFFHTDHQTISQSLR